MARRRKQYSPLTGPIAEFIAGITVGVGVVAGELVVFAFSILMDALSQVARTLPSNSQTPSIDSYFSFITLILIIGGFLQHFFLGLSNSDAFTIGFIIGDVLIVILLGPTLLTISPSVVTGMILALLTVIIGFCIRLFSRSSPKNDFYY